MADYGKARETQGAGMEDGGGGEMRILNFVTLKTFTSRKTSESRKDSDYGGSSAGGRGAWERDEMTPRERERERERKREKWSGLD